MVRSNNNTKKRIPLTGGFFSKFRRAISTHTQKLTNRIPLGYIARFKKAFPNGEITGTGYRYFILNYGDKLTDKIPKNIEELQEDTRVFDILNLDTDNTIRNMLLTKLWNSSKLGIIYSNKDNKPIIKHNKNSTYKTNTNNVNTNTIIRQIRIFIYKSI